MVPKVLTVIGRLGTQSFSGRPWYTYTTNNEFLQSFYLYKIPIPEGDRIADRRSASIIKSFFF